MSVMRACSHNMVGKEWDGLGGGGGVPLFLSFSISPCSLENAAMMSIGIAVAYVKLCNVM